MKEVERFVREVAQHESARVTVDGDTYTVEHGKEGAPEWSLTTVVNDDDLNIWAFACSLPPGVEARPVLRLLKDSRYTRAYLYMTDDGTEYITVEARLPTAGLTARLFGEVFLEVLALSKSIDKHYN